MVFASCRVSHAADVVCMYVRIFYFGAQSAAHSADREDGDYENRPRLVLGYHQTGLATERSDLPRHTADSRWTDRLGERGPKIRISPPTKGGSVGILAIGPPTTVRAITSAGLPE